MKIIIFGRKNMKKLWKRNMVAGAVLLLVCGAIFLNGRYAQQVEETDKILGQATLVDGTEGGYTLYFGNRSIPAPDKKITSAAGAPAFIYDAAMAYAQDGVPLIVIGGEDYGMGSSRDWAAKGTNLLGVKAVITKSFERIHRSNLIGMGVLPLNFADKADYDRIAPLKDATFSILGLDNGIAPRQQVTLRVQPANAEAFDVPVIVRIDTPIEKEYYLAGGILQYVLTQILK
mgnify:CR=1 FL=1